MSAPSEGRWLVRAGIMLLLVAVANSVWGVAALADKSYFAADDLLYGDLSMWATVVLAVALMECITALLLFSGNPAGAYFGILATGLNMIAQLMAIGAYPIWSVIIIWVDVAIVFVIALHCLPMSAE